MKLRQTILILSSLFAGSLFAQNYDEVGIWSEIGIEKAITKNWDVGMDMEYRAQNKARFSIGLGTSYKVNKYLKFGVNYSFLYTERPDKYKIKNTGDVGSDFWETGYNFTPEYWFPRHRFSAEAIGSIKFWKWLKVSLRERYQFTRCKTRSIDQLKHRDTHIMHYDYDVMFDDDGNVMFDDDGNVMYEIIDSWQEETTTDRTETKYYPAYNDQVLRSRLKFEMDKKRCPFSPFVSVEFHNSVSVGDHMLLQKIRTAVGTSYKFRKHNELSLSYLITFDMFDFEENEITLETETVRQHDRLHTISLGYKYSF